MRRWNPLSLVALLVVALLATVLMTPRGALAAPSSLKGHPAHSTTFRGKVVAKDTKTHYFVFTFTCDGTLTGDWTYEVSSTQSFTGTTATPGPTCDLVNGSYTTFCIPLLFNGMSVHTTNLPTQVCPPVPSTSTQAWLSLSFTNIVATKTFFGNFASSSVTGTIPENCMGSGPPSPCVGVQTSDSMLIIPITPTSTTTVPGFSLVSMFAPGVMSFSTLNLSAQ